jgi:hypothetical protein
MSDKSSLSSGLSPWGLHAEMGVDVGVVGLPSGRQVFQNWRCSG